MLDRVKMTGAGQAMASCPVTAHGLGRGDRDPSLHVTNTDGRTLLSCHAGCHVQDVLLALGLDFTDLFDEPLHREQKVLVASYIYRNLDGSPRHIVDRFVTATGKTFTQRMPGAERPGYSSRKFMTTLYRAPEVKAQAEAGGVVYVVEGEKDVHSAESIGMVATTGPNGAKNWQDYYWRLFVGASEVIVVADNDEPGKMHAANVIADLRSHDIKCHAVRVKPGHEKADLTDHVKAGFKAEDLVTIDPNRLRPEGCPMDDLLRKDFPPVRFAVDDLIAAGLTLLGGAPKIGKSYIAQDIALGVALGSNCLSHLTCQQGSVLYLALDNDTERRVKERTQYILAGQDIRHIPMEVHTEWPTGAAALAAVQEWTNETDNPLMVIVDTLVRVEPEFEGNGRENAYAASTNVLSRWAKFAITNNIAVVAVHHDKKGETDDWMDKFTGSRGITATAQTLLFVQAKRGEKVGMLRVTGRDIETDDLELMRYGRTWVAASKPQEVQGTPVLHLVQ